MKKMMTIVMAAALMAVAGLMGFSILVMPTMAGEPDSAKAVDESTMVKLADAQIQYFSQGQGDVVVLLPGGSLSVDYMAGLAKALADAGYRAVRINPRGAGKSTGTAKSVTLHDLAGDVAGVIKSLDVGPVTVAGHAFGNRVARMLDADHPELVKNVILFAAGGKVPPEPDAQKALKEIFDPNTSEADYVAAMAYMVGDPANAKMAGQVLKQSRAPDAAPIQSAAAGTAKLDDWWAPSGKAAYLVLQGTKDQAAPPQNGELLKKDLGDRVTLVPFPGAGHLMLVTEPEKVADAVKNFLKPAHGAADKKVDVNLSNIRTVETHRQFANYQKVAGGINKWQHVRQPVDIDKQTTIAMNRDTFYSFAVVDLAKQMTVTMPEAKGRYMSLQIITEDHYSPFVFEKPGRYKLTEKNVGTRYAFLAVRTFVNPNDPKDIDAVHALQDSIKLVAGSSVPFEIPDYDMNRYDELSGNIQKLIGFWNGDTRGSMGKKGEVDELMHTVATIAGWGLQPPENAMYQVVNIGLESDKKYIVTVPSDVPVKSFWSISIYNAKGYFEKNDLDAYNLNSVTGKKNADGSCTIRLGAWAKGEDNVLPLPAEKGFYHQWRMYGPEKPILEGKWSFADPVEVK